MLAPLNTELRCVNQLIQHQLALLKPSGCVPWSKTAGGALGHLVQESGGVTLQFQNEFVLRSSFEAQGSDDSSASANIWATGLHRAHTTTVLVCIANPVDLQAIDDDRGRTLFSSPCVRPTTSRVYATVRDSDTGFTVDYDIG